ncbi:hypothetical protein A9Q89_09925 [Gammaproteobacteria bacterium 53_120_T64]|nr:hypothetical protein A9Q89_09925 [Gammaproteobacteria bacterium 53_120_T64]
MPKKIKHAIKNSRSALIKLTFIIIFLLSTNTLLGQESQSENNAEVKATPSDESDTQVKKPNKKTADSQQPRTKEKTPSRFKPREAISEDFSVPFPVDI